MPQFAEALSYCRDVQELKDARLEKERRLALKERVETSSANGRGSLVSAEGVIANKEKGNVSRVGSG